MSLTLGRRFEALATGRRAPVGAAEAEAVRGALEAAAAQQDAVRQLIKELATGHPEMDEVLSRVRRLTEV